MERGLLSSDEFQSFRKDLVTFCHITTHIEGQANDDLLARKGGEGGWPYVLFMDEDGNPLAAVDGGTMKDSGFAAFRSVYDSDVKQYLELRERAAKGDTKVKAKFFMRRFELGHFDAEQLVKGLKDEDLDGKQREEVRVRLVELRTNELLHGLDTGRPETFGPTAKKLLAQHADIGLPEGPDGITAWYVVLEDAYLRKDPKTFEMAFTAIRAAGMRKKRFIDLRTKQLEELRKGAK